MSRTAIESSDAVSLVHWECSIEEAAIVEVVESQIATLSVELLAHIIA